MIDLDVRFDLGLPAITQVGEASSLEVVAIGVELNALDLDVCELTELFRVDVASVPAASDCCVIVEHKRIVQVLSASKLVALAVQST